MAKKKSAAREDREQANYRLGRETLRQIDELMAHQQKQTDLRVSRSDVVRRAVRLLHEKEFGEDSKNQ